MPRLKKIHDSASKICNHTSNPSCLRIFLQRSYRTAICFCNLFRLNRCLRKVFEELRDRSKSHLKYVSSTSINKIDIYVMVLIRVNGQEKCFCQ